MVEIATKPADKEAFSLKGSLFTLTVLQLYSNDRVMIDDQLTQAVTASPKFFRHAPIVIDLSQLVGTNIDFAELNQLLRKHLLIPVGVRGGTPTQHQQAQQANLAVLPDSKANATLASRKLQAKPTLTPSKPDNNNARQTVLINTPVRSGQQIYAEKGDLIVTATVSNGAELIADGHIHVYGTLRGRALAGAAGNTDAVIFCHNLQAEMVSIAGRYRLQAENVPITNPNNVKIYLANGRICIDNY